MRAVAEDHLTTSAHPSHQLQLMSHQLTQLSSLLGLTFGSIEGIELRSEPVFLIRTGIARKFFKLTVALIYRLEDALGRSACSQSCISAHWYAAGKQLADSSQVIRRSVRVRIANVAGHRKKNAPESGIIPTRRVQSLSEEESQRLAEREMLRARPEQASHGDR